MKGGIVSKKDFQISLIITGDEESHAKNGTKKVLENLDPDPKLQIFM